jgi:hypothetical protein
MMARKRRKTHPISFKRQKLIIFSKHTEITAEPPTTQQAQQDL